MQGLSTGRWVIRIPIRTATSGRKANLYTNSDLAIDAKTGKLLWYFQFTPHDLHDWDANEPIVLVDAKWKGQGRKLLLHANRNGFLYVLNPYGGQATSGDEDGGQADLGQRHQPADVDAGAASGQ